MIGQPDLTTNSRGPGPDPAARLERALAFAARLVAAVEALALQMGGSDLGAIDLPPVLAPVPDRGHAQTFAALYLAAELEAACLLPAVETLAGLYASGALPGSLGAAEPRLAAFWRSRHERFTPAERTALFNHLFDEPADAPELADAGNHNVEFPGLFMALAQALYRLASAPGYLGDPLVSRPTYTGDLLVSGPGYTADPLARAALALAARELAANLAEHGAGLALFAAREIVAAERQALAILKEPAVQALLRAQNTWEALRAVIRRYLRREVNVDAHHDRGRSGVIMLTWLADALPGLEQGKLPAPGPGVLSAAVVWLQANLALQAGRGRSA